MAARHHHRLAVFVASASAALFCGMPPAISGGTDAPIAVVELFTSEGCSSCPPADKVFARLADDPRLIALSYHVDYWDYLGWKDRLATPANTDRQKRYARSFGTSVFTPEAVVNGRKGVIGSHRDAIEGAIDAMHAEGTGLSVPVSINRLSDRIVVDVGAGKDPEGEAEVVLASLVAERSEPIRGGENEGAVIRYVNAVTRFQTIGIWDGGAERFEMPVHALEAERGPVAVLVQRSGADGPPAILGAALLR